MFRLFLLGLCLLPSLAVAEDSPAGGKIISRNEARNATLTKIANTAGVGNAVEIVNRFTSSIPDSFRSNASSVTVPLERADRPECQFHFGNEVPGMQDVVKQCSDTPSNDSYCECVEKNLLKFVGAKKLQEDRIKAAKNLEKLSADYVVSKWVKEYSRTLKAVASANNFTGGGSSDFLGSLCSPKLIAADVMAAAPNNCDAEQYKTFQASFAKATGLNPKKGEEAQAIEKYLSSSVEPSMDRINGGKIYSCLDESEFNLLMYFGKPTTAEGMGGYMQSPSFSDLRDQKIAEIDTRLNNFSQLLEKSESLFVSSPRKLNPTTYQGRKRVDTDLSKLFEMLPFAKVLLYEYTSEKTLNPDGVTFTILTAEQRKANFQKMKSLVKELTQFTQEMKATKANDANSLKDGYNFSARFNLRLKNKLSDIKTNKQNGLSSLTSERCTELSEQLLAMACIKPVMSRPAYVAQILGRVGQYGMPSAGECVVASMNGGEQLYNCQVAESAGCAYPAPRRNVDDSTSSAVTSSYIKEMFATKEAYNEGKKYIMERNQLAKHFCSDYSQWVDNASPCAKMSDADKRKCMIEGAGSRSAFSKLNPTSNLAKLASAKETVDSETGGAASAGISTSYEVADSMNDRSYRKRYEDVAAALGSSLEGMGSSTALAQPLQEGGFLQAFSEMTQGAAAQIANQTGGTQASNQMNLAPFINPEAFKREVAEKEEEIKEKEEEIAQRVAEKQSAPVAEQAGLSAQIAALQADLKRLQDERNELERQQQQIAATDAEVAGSGNTPAANSTPSKRTRVPASVSSSDDEEVRSSAFNTGTTGGTVGAAASSTAAASAGFNTAGSFGGSLGAARAGTVQGLNAALLAANEAKALVISGQSIPTTNVVSLEVANVKDTASLEQLISAQKDRLQFNSEGWATVEVIDQATKSTIYMQVRLDNSKLVVTQLPSADQQGIRKQVREWTASYTNFLKNIKKVKRDTAGVTE